MEKSKHRVFAVKAWEVTRNKKNNRISDGKLLIDEVIDRENISVQEAREYAQKKARGMKVGTDFFCAVYVKNLVH